jgi:uncharacterized membrane protein YczE
MYKYWIVFGVIYFFAGLLVLVFGGGLIGQVLQDSVAGCLAGRDFVLHHNRLPDKLEQRKLIGGSIIVGLFIDIIMGLLESPPTENTPVWIIVIAVGIALVERAFVLYLTYGWGVRKLFGPRS